MEPLSALGVAANVLQFVDFAGKLLSLTVRIHRARNKSNSKAESNILENITRDLTKHNETLKISTNDLGDSYQSQLSLEDREIVRICTDCEQVAAKFLHTLAKLKNGKATAWASFVDALKTIWTESEVETLRQTLDSYRQQIQLYLLTSIRVEIRTFQQEQLIQHAQVLTEVRNTRASVANLFTKVAGDATYTQKATLERNVVQAMRDDYERKTYSKVSPAVEMQTLLADDDAQRFYRGLLGWLRFKELETRHEKIPHAYQQTYEWIFRTPSQGQWSDFRKWLGEDGEALYWITGKPAAGKSTLMKFIYTNPITTTYLRRWAKGKTLIICAFYFWISGTQMQMSQEGMVRTLIYEALHQEPKLWATLFPHKMEEFVAFGDPWQEPITWEEMMRALRRLVEGAGKDYKVFFFIDGLDEFDGDSKNLIDMVTGFLSPSVKTCVSSRPWNVFEDSFQQRPSLRLEELTHADIKHFVNSQFLQNRGFAQRRMLDSNYATKLIENITLKASGVFLWVSLVTDSLLEGFSDGERVEELQARLDALPSDLENLFWKLLTRLGSLERASQLLQIIRSSLTPVTLLTLYYADEADPAIASKIKAGPLPTSQSNGRAVIIRRRLNAYCRGLIESKTSPGQPLHESIVGYLHRTVQDYLHREDIWASLLTATTSSFNPHARLCNAHIIVHLKHGGHTLYFEEPSNPWFWEVVTYGIRYASLADPDCVNGLQTKLLNEIDAAASYVTSIQDQNGRTFLDRFHRNTSHWTGAKEGFELNKSLLDLMVTCKCTEYVRSMVSSSTNKPSPAMLSNALAVALVQSTIGLNLNAVNIPATGLRPDPALVILLLQHGANPNTGIKNGLSHVKYINVAHAGGTFSPWEIFLQAWGDDVEGWKHVKKVGKAFLDHGANPSLIPRKFPTEIHWKARRKRMEALLLRIPILAETIKWSRRGNRDGSIHVTASYQHSGHLNRKRHRSYSRAELFEVRLGITNA
ncbi:uncharacterized protein BDR25DRAFT_35094 [Lindgomyces ingoldianus]|uniref:Uncharacterized protein n=1 Tax=Lindgomyces ingoldianus TaxID=673940 RepID=A0ACB6QV70_9PLEO|nr:uncharacterized protein BDR25DRAFT_35094 [Lindgomyces ingoldianus]KAF2470468.1 hypothetical protein BDR25DRAFT_35094 [Lindgomyces ingoldianus]